MLWYTTLNFLSRTCLPGYSVLEPGFADPDLSSYYNNKIKLITNGIIMFIVSVMLSHSAFCILLACAICLYPGLKE